VGSPLILGGYHRPVATVWGRRPEMPRELLAGVAAQATRFGRRVAGDDLFLLALSELPGEPPARRVLDAEGLDSSRIVEEIRAPGDGQSEGEERIHFAPALYRVMGRAEGLGAALGNGAITPEHVLLALLWDPMSLSSQLLWRMGIKRQRVIDRLRDVGVPVPPAALPEQRPIQFGERVWIERDQVQAVASYVGRHLPPDAAWGFNFEGDRAWVNAESRVDLQALVDEALTEPTGDTVGL
jgi:ATP-dependent Clp protease ATP-binding subunit ClpA